MSYPKCEISGCLNPARAKRGGLCGAHNERKRKHGSPTGGGATPAKPGEPFNFIKKVVANPPNDCVIWPYAKSTAGYGYVEKTTAHRLALMLYTGIDKEGFEAAHGPCHNRLCVNPLHLSWKTPTDNNRDKLRDKTHLQKGESHVFAKISEDQAIEIIALRGVFLQRELAEIYGLHPVTICNIQTGRSWSHLNRG